MHEFRSAIGLLGFTNVGKDEVDELFKLFDKDGGGYVDYNELNRLLRKRRSPSPGSPGSPDGGSSLDAGSSYALSSHGPASPPPPAVTLSASVRREHRGTLPPAERPRALKGVSLELDGAWTLVEQLSAQLRKSGRRGADLFKEWDYDGTGSLSRANLHMALRAIGVSDAAAVEALFALLAKESSVLANESPSTSGGQGGGGQGGAGVGAGGAGAPPLAESRPGSRGALGGALGGAMGAGGRGGAPALGGGVARGGSVSCRRTRPHRRSARERVARAAGSEVARQADRTGRRWDDHRHAAATRWACAGGPRRVRRRCTRSGWSTDRRAT